MKKVVLVLSILSYFGLVYGQIITNDLTPEEAIQDVLTGGNSQITNVRFNGVLADANSNQVNVKQFDANVTLFPISEGVYISTSGGSINDADLEILANDEITNGAIIEFDFVANSDTLSFNYIFASSEYEDYTCGSFNDVFGFFLSGPGVNGPFTNNAINIATVPGSNNIPVGINTVNSGTASGLFPNPANCSSLDPNWQQNAIFFTEDYNQTFANSTGLEVSSSFNGGTVILPAAAGGLVCGETYSIKIAIGNAFDEAFDSGVFLEANSFTTGESLVDIGVPAGSPVGDTAIVANCQELELNFMKPTDFENQAYDLEYQITGTAQEGIDFPEIAPNGVISFGANENEKVITIVPTNGGPSDAPLSLTITLSYENECGDTQETEYTVWLFDLPPTIVNATETDIFCIVGLDSIEIEAETANGLPPYDYSWDNGVNGSSFTINDFENNQTYEFIVTSTDSCGFQFSDTARVIIDETLVIESLTQTPSECGIETGSVLASLEGETGSSSYLWVGPGSDATESSNLLNWENVPSGMYYFTVEDDVCTKIASIFVEEENPPVASFNVLPEGGNAPIEITFENNSQGGVEYIWDFGNGDGIIVENQSNQSSMYTEEGDYVVELIAIEGGCSDTVTIIVPITDFAPLIYDLPNIFTPNGDQINDVFTINAQNAISLEMVIVNRWGNVVFESHDNLNPSWNGKVENTGNEVGPGTYFYKFTITGEDGNSFEEHGYVQLVRK